jgi:putative copper export protein
VSLLATIGPTVARWGLFVSMTLMLGVVALRLVVLPRWKGSTTWAEVIPGADRTSANLGLIAAVVMLLVMPLILVDQIILFRDPFEPLSAELSLLVTGTMWGRVWQLQLFAAGLAVVAFVAVRIRGGGDLWWVAAGVVVLCATTPALGGHSAGSMKVGYLAVAADALHVIAAGAWLGTLAALVIVVRRAVGRGASASAILPEAVASFSPLAIVSTGVVVSTGVFATWLHIGSLGGLVGSLYGRVVLLKAALVGVVACLGAYNWKRVTPRLDSADGSKVFLSTSAPSELFVGLVVLLVTAVLVVMPHPMEP